MILRKVVILCYKLSSILYILHVFYKEVLLYILVVILLQKDDFHCMVSSSENQLIVFESFFGHF